MTRNLIFACVVLGVAALATVWALSPGCEGSFCFGKGAETEAAREAATVSVVPGTGREAPDSGAQEPAPAAASDVWLSTDEAADPDSEAGVLEQTGEAVESTEAWQDQGTSSTGRATGDASVDGSIEAYEEPELTPEQRRVRQAAAEKAAKQWDSLVEAALGEPDDELRGEAINGVALHRSAESVAVLNEVAAFDPSPDNRLQAVQQLWYSAADGLDPDGGIRSTLQAALDDPDDDIAEMAEKALADLQALEESRAFN